jgi:sterol desaturase/sphingolipid hydroxylase (fatty acid hydroxylase superfamily)
MLAARPESPRMFNSDFVDFFSRTPWWSVPVIWIPIVLGFFGYGIVGEGVVWYFAVVQALAGVVVWSLSEYWLHRTVFHWEPDNAFGRRFHFIIHGCHHTWVDDPYRLVMPPAAGVMIATVFWFAFQGTAATLAPWLDPTWVAPFMAGFLAGYINYDLTHYATHHVELKNKRLIKIRAHHMNHHFNDPDKRFGFTTFVWDRVFGTY